MKPKMKAVMSYVPVDDYRKVRTILAHRGVSFSEWVRECMSGAISVGWPIMGSPKARKGKA